MKKAFNFSHNSTLADSEPDWGSIDKAALPRPAFADQGEEGKKSTWSYPHHWIENGGGKDDMGCYATGTMYLHKGGLNAAWSAAQGGRSGEEAPQAVKDHLQVHRSALGIEDLAATAKRYGIKAQAGEAEIWIYEEIGEGWFGGLSAKQFSKDLRDLGDLHTIKIRLNSPGGNVFDGVAIYNILKQHKAKVAVGIDGLAASIASVIAMAGDEIHMAENAMMMIHQAWGLTVGNAAEMRKMAEMLDKLDGSISGTYSKRTKIDEAKINELMAAETWMTAQEALDYGFVDSITDSLDVAASFDLSKFQYRHIPEKMMAPKGDHRNELARLNLRAQKLRIASNPRQ